MGSYNHDFVSFRRWFFSVINISYGKYGFLSTCHIVKTLSFPVVVVVVVVVVACINLQFRTDHMIYFLLLSSLILYFKTDKTQF
jgi:hypothetical protein